LTSSSGNTEEDSGGGAEEDSGAGRRGGFGSGLCVEEDLGGGDEENSSRRWALFFFLCGRESRAVWKREPGGGGRFPFFCAEGRDARRTRQDENAILVFLVVED